MHPAQDDHDTSGAATPELTGACLCGAVGWRYQAANPDATICNCTACRRYGVLWIYGDEGHDVHVDDPDDRLTHYVRDSGSLSFDFCSRCGNLVSWRALKVRANGRVRMAVNLRLADPEAAADIPLQRFDGLHSFDDLPKDGRRVADVWF